MELRSLISPAFALIIVAMALFAPAAAAEPQPLTEPDRQLLIAVRQLGLWEIPTGQQALERARSPIVKDVGTRVLTDHTQLEEEVRAVADQLGVPLPSEPSAEQQAWMAELATKTGADYDQAFTNRLRAADGTVFPMIAQVRVGTKNDAIRAFAGKAGDVLTSHLTLLEGTGLVRFDGLPEPTPPVPAPVPAASSHGSGGVNIGLVVAICAAELGATVGLVRLFRSR